MSFVLIVNFKMPTIVGFFKTITRTFSCMNKLSMKKVFNLWALYLQQTYKKTQSSPFYKLMTCVKDNGMKNSIDWEDINLKK